MLMRRSPTLVGHRICRGVLDPAQIISLRAEADRVAEDAGSACVRNLQERSRVFAALAESELLKSLLPRDLIPVRSILFDKREGANWPVAWHRDLTICVDEKPTQPLEGYGPWSVKDGVPHVQAPLELLREMITLRIHLDLTDSDNGALCVVPGSHLLESEGREVQASIDEAMSVSCDCAEGDVLMMSPLILHSSPRSKKQSRRRVVHFEYAPAEALHSALRWGEIAAPTQAVNPER